MTLPELSETLVEPDPAEPSATVLELDELWSFVLKKANKRWIWIALCRATRQVVAYVVGDRSAATCQKLWQQHSRQTIALLIAESDFWEAYQLVIPSPQHTAAGKEIGRDGARRAMEQHAATKTRTLCQKEPVILQV
ncbi:MAG: IS1 family transposase [Pyrinomonadaceae bacterium]